MDLLNEYKEKNKELEYLAHAVALMNYEMETIAPDKGKAKLADSIAFFSTKRFEKATSDEFYDRVCKLSEPSEFDKLDDVYKYDVSRTKEDLDKLRRVPADFFAEHVKTVTASAIAWPKAKQNNDFASFEKPLSETIETTKKINAYTDPDKAVYDALIDGFEKGMTIEKIDKAFGELKKELVPLLDKILSCPQPDHEKFTMTVPVHEQEKLSDFLLDYIGIDKDAFCQAQTEHPFTESMSITDVRIANHYYENEVLSAIFSTIHEGGHALYEQNVDLKYEGTQGAVLNYMGLHESQSRFFENILGRNINFWKPIWPDVVKIVPEFESITLEDFYREINHVKNSYIRTEADELTYCLHVILRYEVEKSIFIDGVEVKDLPALWNSKMEELLHITPRNDAEGVLQDSHWSNAQFGYFPSYLLGNIYDGMFLETMEKELGSIDDILSAGNIKDITKWLNENIHRYGSTRTSGEVLAAVCGTDELSAQPIIKYFKDKYSRIYEL